MNLSDYIFISTVKCPGCGHEEKIAMPKYAQKHHYECQKCKYVFQTKKSQCCIFCSYGDVPCPTEQQKRRIRQLSADSDRDPLYSKDPEA